MFVLKRNYDDLLEEYNILNNKLSECTIKCNQHFNEIIKIKKELDDTNDSYNSLNDKHDDLINKYNNALLEIIDYKNKSSNSSDESKYYSDLLDLAFQDIDDKEELVQVLKNKIAELNDILITYTT